MAARLQIPRASDASDVLRPASPREITERMISNLVVAGMRGGSGGAGRRRSAGAGAGAWPWKLHGTLRLSDFPGMMGMHLLAERMR